MSHLIGQIGLVISGAILWWIVTDILWAVRCFIVAWGHDRRDLSGRRHLEHQEHMRIARRDASRNKYR